MTAVSSPFTTMPKERTREREKERERVIVMFVVVSLLGALVRGSGNTSMEIVSFGSAGSIACFLL